MYEVNHNSRTY